MNRIPFALLALTMLACNNEKKEEKTDTGKITDLFLYNIKGDLVKSTDSIFVTDNTGKMVPDSIAVEYGEFKDGFLDNYVSIDSTGKNKTLTYYLHHENGLFMGQHSVTNGRLADSTAVDLDSAGKYKEARKYDASHNLVQRYKVTSFNDYNAITGMQVYDKDGKLILTETSNYDKQIYVGGTSLDSSGKELTRITVRLNEKADPVEELTIRKGEDSTITDIKKYRYDKYDETGNWTQRTELDKNNKPVKIVRKTLEYAKKED